MTILIIEDEVPAQQLLQHYCTQAYPKATVLAASSVYQAEEYLTGSHINVAISDIDLSDGTGAGLAERCARTVPSMFTTAYSDLPSRLLHVAHLTISSSHSRWIVSLLRLKRHLSSYPRMTYQQ